MPDIVPSFCAQPFEVAVLFNLNLSRCPFFREVANLDLLLCTGFHSEHVVLFLCHISTQRPTWMTNWRFSEAMGTALVGNNFSSIPSKISFCMKRKSDYSLPKIYKSLKPRWIFNGVNITRVVACFLQASLSWPAATAAYLETPCVYSCQSYQPKLWWSAAPRALPLILQPIPLIVFWNSLREWLPDDWQSLKLELKTWTLPSDKRVVEVLSALKSRNHLCWVWILFKTQNLRTAVSQINPHPVTDMMLIANNNCTRSLQVCYSDLPVTYFYVVPNMAGCKLIDLTCFEVSNWDLLVSKWKFLDFLSLIGLA